MTYVSVSNDPFIGDGYQFLYNAMSELWHNLMDGKPGCGVSTTAKVKKDIEDLMNELRVDKSWEASKQAYVSRLYNWQSYDTFVK